LQWALPRAGRRWEGYRKVRRRVCKKISRRALELNLPSLSDYRRYLEEDPQEWRHLDALLDVTISRFYRDRSVFDFIAAEIVPTLVRRAHLADYPSVRVWSTGCANGEEPYTIALMWEFSISPDNAETELHILATDIKTTVLRRAEDALYPRSSLNDLPAQWKEAAFDQSGDVVALAPRFRQHVTFAQHDIRGNPPGGGSVFDLIMCRYQAFTYFDEAGQRNVLNSLTRATRPGSVLVLGRRETMPSGAGSFRPLEHSLGVFKRCD